MNFDSKVAVIVGGASGIGEASARTLAQLGASVVIGDVDEDRGEELCASLSDQGFSAKFCRTDVMCEEDIDALMKDAVQSYGGLDILHNCAGIPRSIAPDCEVIDMPLEWWNRTITGHLTGAMLGCKHALPHMIARGGGAIVNTASAAGFWATADLTAYSAAKAGIIQLTREVAATYGRNNVRCNVVVPGLVLTPRGLATLTPQQIELFAQETPLPRIATAQDLANVVVFLASEGSSMITGQSLQVDGGMMIKLPYWKAKMQASRGTAFDELAFKMTS